MPAAPGLPERLEQLGVDRAQGREPAGEIAGERGVISRRDPFAVPEPSRAYPEPSMFGLLPASAIYARHVEHLTLRDVRYEFAAPDERPLVVLDHATDVTFSRFRAPCRSVTSPYHLTSTHASENFSCTPAP